MKKLAAVLLALVIGSSVFAIENPKSKGEAKAAPSLVGMVVDQETGEALTGVSVKIDGTDKCVFTDFEGQFEIKNLEPGTYTFSVSLISYKTNSLKDVELAGGEKKALKVELKR